MSKTRKKLEKARMRGGGAGGSRVSGVSGGPPRGVQGWAEKRPKHEKQKNAPELYG